MSDTPPMGNATPMNGHGREKTPDLTSKRERRHREDDEDDRDRHARPDREHREHREQREHRERDPDRERERRERHRRHYEDDGDRERERDRDRERKRRYEYDDHDEERRRRRRERESREYDDRRESREHRERDRSRESHRSHRSRGTDPDAAARRDVPREEREAERARRDREMYDERREAGMHRGGDRGYGNMDRERERRSSRDYPSPPRRMARSPPRRNSRPPPPPPQEQEAPPQDPASQLLHEVDSEARSVFVSQLAARLTSQDLGLFFEDKLGRGAVRDARVVMDRVSRRSKGIGYVELDAVELVSKALALSGVVVMGIPISITLTESEKNRDGVDIASIMAGGRHSRGVPQASNNYVPNFPPLSTGLQFPPGVDIDRNRYASIPYHRLFVSNIASTLNKEDITQVFEAFGEIEFVDLHINFNGQSKETAYVQFKDLRPAQMAVDAMNGFELAGRHIKVVAFQERNQMPEQVDDPRRGPRMDNNTRQQLMFKLARQDQDGSAAPARRYDPPSRREPVDPTRFIVVHPMFNPDKETERNWDLDLAEDVKGELEEKYGLVKRIKVDKMSAGEVYVEFETVRNADAAAKGLNGRFFSGNKLQANFISEALFKAHL